MEKKDSKIIFRINKNIKKDFENLCIQNKKTVSQELENFIQCMILKEKYIQEFQKNSIEKDEAWIKN